MTLADAHNVAVMVHTFYDGPGLRARMVQIDCGSTSEQSRIEFNLDLFRTAPWPAHRC